LHIRALALKTLGLPFLQRKRLHATRYVRRVLCIRVDRVGDMVLSTPAFQAIKDAWPQSRLTVLASPFNAPILENNPHVDEVIIYNRRAGLLKKMKQILQMRLHPFDLAIDLHADDELPTAFLAVLSRAAHRIGYSSFGREAFFTGPPVPIEVRRPVVDSLLGLLRENGIVFDDGQAPRIYLSDTEKRWAGEWLAGQGMFHGPWIAIHPGAHYETQRWPAEYYAELIGLIRRQSCADIILLGGPSDAGVIGEVMTRVREDVCLSIQDDLRKFLAILSQCRMLVCNNSGPLHCAAALGIPTLSFMGPTVKERWIPVGEGHHVLRRDELPCIGCNSGQCRIKTHDCMRLIRPDTVFGIIQQGLEHGIPIS
jgi:lipopolysaccharide heptosyltransferase II